MTLLHNNTEIWLRQLEDRSTCGSEQVRPEQVEQKWRIRRFVCINYSLLNLCIIKGVLSS